MVPKQQSSLMYQRSKQSNKTKTKLTYCCNTNKMKRSKFKKHLLEHDESGESTSEANGTSSRPFACTQPKCCKAFRSSKLRASHIRNMHSAPIICPVKNCGFTARKYCIPQHLRTVHEKVRYPCRRCAKQFVLKSSLYNHEQSCLNSDGTMRKSFLCLEKGCGKVFRSNAQRLSHAWGRHTSRIECPIPRCGKMVFRCYLTTHIRCDHDKMKEKCNDCGAEVRYGTLGAHLKKSCRFKREVKIIFVKGALKREAKDGDGNVRYCAIKVKSLDDWVIKIGKTSEK